MKIRIYFFGKQNEISKTETELIKRINFRAKCEIISIPQAGINESEKAKELESNKFLSKIGDQYYLIAFDEHGQELSSLQFSKFLKDQLVAHNEVVFVIGGAHGLHEKILNRANTKISCSKMVWTRNLFRHMACEQIYRALEIDGGSNFHK